MVLMLLFVVIASCDREPLELYKKGDSEVILKYKFEEGFNDMITKYNDFHSSNPFKVNGLYVMFAKDGDKITSSFVTDNFNLGDTEENKPKGHYNIVAMTNTFSEYEGNMSFYNTDSYEKIMAVSNTYDISDMNAWDGGRRYLKEPIPIGVATNTLDVTMDDEGRVFYEYNRGSDINNESQEKELVMKPMITTLTITVKVRGINYLKSISQGGVDGYITGLADGFYLTQFWRRSEVGDIKLTNWRFGGYVNSSAPRRADGDSEGDSEYKVGKIIADVQTFGLPHGRELLYQRTEQSNFLMLHFTMVNDETIDFAYNVGKMVRYEDDDGTENATFTKDKVALELNLNILAPNVDDEHVPTIPYAQPKGTGSFDAEVEDWGDDENIDVPM